MVSAAVIKASLDGDEVCDFCEKNETKKSTVSKASYFVTNNLPIADCCSEMYVLSAEDKT